MPAPRPLQSSAALLTRTLASGAARLPVSWFRVLSRVSLVVPYYHVVSDAPLPHIAPLYRYRSVAEFSADLAFFQRHFEPVTLARIIDALDGRATLPPACFHLTFDDGFREMHDIVAPILLKAGVPATFFLNTAFLDGGGLAHHNVLALLIDRFERKLPSLSPALLQQIETLLPHASKDSAAFRTSALRLPRGSPVIEPLASLLGVDLPAYIRNAQPYLSSTHIRALLHNGFSIGAHSHDHPLYAEIPLAEQLSQTHRSMTILQNRFGLRRRAFAFPHTDAGVAAAFFNEIYREPFLDVSFGTGGLLPHFHPRNIERVRMEKTSAPASRIVARQFERAAYFRFRSR